MPDAQANQGDLVHFTEAETAFADRLVAFVLDEAERRRIGSGVVCTLLGRIAGLLISEAGIDGQRRRELLDEMGLEAAGFAEACDRARPMVDAVMPRGCGHA